MLLIAKDKDPVAEIDDPDLDVEYHFQSDPDLDKEFSLFFLMIMLFSLYLCRGNGLLRISY